jgi:sarcosine oxidase subunit alpha
VGERRRPSVERGAPVTISFDGRAVRGFAGEPAAVALLAAGRPLLGRSIKYHRPRGAFCFEGHCGACLVRVDGLPNQRACVEPCREGLALEGQNAFPSAELDALGAVDLAFPGGMDHHTLMTGSHILNAVTRKVVRRLSGLGRVPDRPAPPAAPGEDLAVDVAIVGGGPAGLAAAEACARARLATALFDDQPELGGSLLADLDGGPGRAAAAIAGARAAGAALHPGAVAIGAFADDGGVVAIATADRLVRVRARATIHATGGYPQNRRFADNDRPGVIAARAAARLLVRHGVVPGERVVVVGDQPDALRLAAALAAAGATVAGVDGVRERIVGVEGARAVAGAIVEDARGARRTIPCDAIAIDAPAAPASELWRQQGGAVELRPAAGGFAAVVDADGRGAGPGAWACGDVAGYVGPRAAAAAGARTGAAVARALGGA